MPEQEGLADRFATLSNDLALMSCSCVIAAGNICRSPSAEAVFRAVVEREGLADRFEIDSCGTGGGNPEWYRTEDRRRGWSYHEGDDAGVLWRKNLQKLVVVLRTANYQRPGT